jgi:dTDP-L-rhamnose 4-epimerase
MAQNNFGRILVTGGAGFIGSAMSQLLAPLAEDYVVFDNLHPQIHPTTMRPEGQHEAAKLVVGDVADPKDWDLLLSSFNPDVVIHLAAETGTAQSLDEASRHADVNVVGTTQMLDAFGRHGLIPGRFLLSSSRAVYGEGQWLDKNGTTFSPGQRTHQQLVRKEWDFPDSVAMPSNSSDTPPAPTSIYGATKLAQEHILNAWANSRDSQLTTLRLQNVYGPGQSLINSYTGIVSLFSQWAMDNRVIPVYEDGLITRDFVYIDDVAAAFVAALEYVPTSEDLPFDIGFGQPQTILDAAQFIAGYHDAPDPQINGAFRDGDVRHASCSIDYAREKLGWSPQWNLEKGLSELQIWIGQQIAAGSQRIV